MGALLDKLLGIKPVDPVERALARLEGRLKAFEDCKPSWEEPWHPDYIGDEPTLYGGQDDGYVMWKSLFKYSCWRCLFSWSQVEGPTVQCVTCGRTCLAKTRRVEPHDPLPVIHTSEREQFSAIKQELNGPTNSGRPIILQQHGVRVRPNPYREEWEQKLQLATQQIQQRLDEGGPSCSS